MIKVSAELLESFVFKVFKSVGMNEDHAKIIANHLVTANLRGVDSHGIIRVRVYLNGIKDGLINPQPKIKAISNGPTYAILDGDRGLGHIVAYEATRLAIEKAKENKVALVGTRNHWHIGMLSYYILEVIKQDMIGICMANSSPRVSLKGFTKGIVGTNPLAIGFPTPSFPLIYDGAMSVVSAGKILAYKKEGKSIPLGWAINKSGELTTDPDEALEGFLLPIGSYKGLDIALAIDILCGIVMGGNVGLKLPRTLFTQGGFTLITFRIDAFKDIKEYYEEVKHYIKMLKDIKGRKGQELILPGEREAKFYEERIREGIPLPKEVYKELVNISKEYLGSNMLQINK